MQPDLDDRVTSGADAETVRDVVTFLTRLADGDLTSTFGTLAPGALPKAHALVDGVNSLAERLRAERRETQERVQSRATELEQLNSDVMRLSEFGNLLQACENSSEAYEVIEHEVGLHHVPRRGALPR